MKIKELKEFLNNLPEADNELPVTVKMVELPKTGSVFQSVYRKVVAVEITGFGSLNKALRIFPFEL